MREAVLAALRSSGAVVDVHTTVAAGARRPGPCPDDPAGAGLGALRELRVPTHLCTPDEVADLVDGLVADLPGSVAAHSLPAGWCPRSVPRLGTHPHGDDVADLSALVCDVVALSLDPPMVALSVADHHVPLAALTGADRLVAVVRTDQVVVDASAARDALDPTLPSLLFSLGSTRLPPEPVVSGVRGPRYVDVVIVSDGAEPS